MGLLLNPLLRVAPLPSGLHCAFPTLPTGGRVWSPTLPTTFLVRPDAGARRRAWECEQIPLLSVAAKRGSASGNLLQTLTGFLKNESISLSVVSNSLPPYGL